MKPVQFFPIQQSILCIALVVSFFGVSFGQVNLSVGAKHFVRDLTALSTPDRVPQEMILAYDLQPISEDFAVGVAGLVKADFNVEQLENLDINLHSRVGDICTFRVPLKQFHEFLRVPGLLYVDISDSGAPFLDRALPSTRIDSVHLGLGGLDRAYKGSGTIIAVIDWGFDYTHPNFYNENLDEMRLTRAWDQNKLSGPPPAGYSFGTEYVGKDALLAAGQDTLYVFGPMSHGTHVAGIAGGSSAGTPHLGAAPESELVFISLKRDSPSLIDAYTYIRDYAASVGKPFVVNMSFGLHQGPHDGNLLPSLAIDMMHGPGRVYVASAGNNGSAPFHIDHDFQAVPETDTMRTVVGFTNTADYFGQTLSIWGSPNSSFAASIILANNANQIIYETPFYHTMDVPSLDEVIVINNDTFRIILESLDVDLLSGRPHIQMQLRNLTGLKVVLQLTSEDSHIHVWNTVRQNIRFTNWGVGLSANYPGAKAGDIHFGIGEPGGCGKNTITVGSYQVEQYLPSGNPITGQISGFSSRGPTVDGRTKPEITSTGQSIVSSINSFDISETTGFSSTLDFQGRTYAWKAYSGTSMSGPMVAGMVALMMEANPQISANEVREILKSTARLDIYTGVIGSEGSNTWGWGKANALAAVLAAEALISSNEIVFTEPLIRVFPNPASSEVYLEMEQDLGVEPVDIQIFNLNGQRVGQHLIIPSSGLQRLPIHDLPTGFYLMQFRSGEHLFFNKLVVE